MLVVVGHVSSRHVLVVVGHVSCGGRTCLSLWSKLVVVRHVSRSVVCY
jgi:hypothetical protein